MNKTRIIIIASILIVWTVLPAFATEKRVIEEKLIYNDPTVAKPDEWIFGISLDFWYLTDIGMYTEEGEEKERNGEFYGGGIWFGKGTSALFLNINGGNKTYEKSTTKTVYTEKNDRINGALKFRELMPSLDFEILGFNIVPYFLLGGEIEKYDGDGKSTGLKVGRYNGQKVRYTSRQYTDYAYEGFLGLGIIIPFCNWAGYRTDLSGVYSYVERKIDFQNATTSDPNLANINLDYGGSGCGTNWTSTFYFDLFEGLNLQAGWQYEWRYYPITGMGTGANWGFFGMLGYTF